METRTEKNASYVSMPRSRASRNEQLYKDINKMELQNYEVKSNATVLGDNRKSIDVDKIKSILDTHYNDAPKRKTIAIETNEEEAPNPIFETKEYDINVVINKAKEQKHEEEKEESGYKLNNTQLDILKDLDIEEEEPEDRAITKEKSKELESLLNTISINEQEIEKAKQKKNESEEDIPEVQYDEEEPDTEEDLFASLLGTDDTQTIEMPQTELEKEIDDLKTEGIDLANLKTEEQKIVVEKEDIDKNKKEKIEKEPEKESLDNSFFTKSNAIKKKDFEDYEELDEEEESSNTFVKVFIILLLIVFIVGIIILVKSFI